MALLEFLVSATGRFVRVIAGAGLIALGLLVFNQNAGVLLAVIGLVPLFAGLLDYCVVALLFGLPLDGDDLRDRIAEDHRRSAHVH